MRKRNDDLAAAKIKPSVIGGLILFMIVTVVFSISVRMRSEHTGEVSLWHHNHLTGTSMLFTNNWLSDGILNDRFAMIMNPASIEFKSLDDRGIYDSYPPGCLLPLYALAKITGSDQIDFTFIHRWDLFNQYMVTLTMVMLIYLVFLKMKIKVIIGMIAALPPVAVNIFMPSPYYFFHSIYFADQAVLLPFVLTVLLEFLRSNTRHKKLVNTLEWLMICFGTFTDYLFICIVIVIYVKRLILGEIKLKPIGRWFTESLKFASPAITAIALFILQIIINGPQSIIDMFLYRTGLGGADEYVRNFNHYFWKTYIVDGYGHNADILLKASFLIVAALIVGYIILRKLGKIREDEQMKTLLSVSATVIFPCFLQVYLLRNHSAIHDFSALKFSIVLSVVTFSLLPAAIVEAIKIAIPKFNRQFLMICTATVFTTVCLVTTRNFFAEKGDSFFPSKLNPEVESMGTFVSENTGYEDLVFSDRYAVVGATEDPPRNCHYEKANPLQRNPGGNVRGCRKGRRKLHRKCFRLQRAERQRGYIEARKFGI